MANVLIVEDEWLIAESYAKSLRSGGHEVIGPFPTAEKAISALREEDADVALLDMDLFGEMSFQLAERLQDREIPFIFVSGHSRKELPASLKDKRVLSKPVTSTDLLNEVRNMVGTS